MPRRTDIKSVLVIGSGPIVIGQACEFDYSGTQACRVLKAEGIRVILVNSNPATIMTDPEIADATYVEPITPHFVAKVIDRERPDALLATLGGQTALNAAVALAHDGTLEKFGVELIGASIEAIESGREPRVLQGDRRVARRRGRAQRGLPHARRLPGGGRGARLPGGVPAVLHDGRGRFGHGVRPRRPASDRRRRSGRQPDHRGAPRGVDPRLEGVRARGDARRQRQHRHRVLDREPRPDGRPHRRLDHGGAGDDAHGPRVPGDARHGDRRDPRRRRRDRWLQHPVRDRPERRPDDRDRDEPAGVAVQRAGVEGDRVPDREDRRQGRRRLLPRRDPQRHHARDAGVLRADARLRGGQGAAFRLREVPRGRPAADDAHEERRRGDGDRA